MARSKKIETRSKRRILVIGAGNMGSSLLRGLARSGHDAQLFAVDLHQDKLDRLHADLPEIQVYSSLEDAARELWSKRNTDFEDCVVLCIKPQDLESTAAKIRGRIGSHCALVISILAGVPMSDVAKALDFKGPLVRAMPNIAAMVGAAATALAPNEQITPTTREWAESIFASTGQVVWAKESHLDAVTGLSGSGPAYVYMVIEALTDGGVKMGLPRDMAAKLASQTVLGSAMLVQQTGLHPAVLRDQVTTPGGTTISAIHELERHGLRAMLISAVATATERSALLRDLRKK
jgi:pyrroline-5-carboxylate reductase